MTTAKHIIDMLARHKIPMENEKETQTYIDRIFKKHPAALQSVCREYHFNENDIIDFFLNHSIGIEVKINVQASKVYEQLERYAQNEKVKELVLVTTKTMGLPKTINNKPVYLHNISKSWL